MANIENRNMMSPSPENMFPENVSMENEEVCSSQAELTENVSIEDKEVYSSAAELYHKFRPRYPAHLLDQALKDLPLNGEILELGCGPGTATVPLLQRGFKVTAIEPGSGMMKKARHVCRGFTNVTFHETTLKTYSEKYPSYEKFDAIVAASSFHWAMRDDKCVVARCHRLLKQNGKLVLLWNLPPEPNSDVRDAVAKATGNDLPFYFGGSTSMQHNDNLRRQVLHPIEDLGLFSSFVSTTCETEIQYSANEYISYLHTLSPYIRMPTKEREQFLEKAKAILTRLCQPCVLAKARSILNLATKLR